MATKTICRKCRNLISNHCTAEPVEVLDSCSCYTRGGWDKLPTPGICDRKYTSHQTGGSICRNCGHDAKCHIDANGAAE